MPLKQCFKAIVWCAALVGAAFAQSSYDEPWRPQFHFTPAKNFMNDPNGMVFYKGEYHLFYQYNPEGNVWGHMSWGHAVSADMLHWKHLPVAIPEVSGKYMIYSGSIVVDLENSSGLCKPVQEDRSCLVAIFTAAAKDAAGKEHQDQHLAYSNDRGRTWKEYEGNPVVDLSKPDFRDPKVFWYAPQNKWVMVAVLADERKLEIFYSKDLKNWKQQSEFGPAGDTEGQWECPDLFELPVQGSDERKWVLVINRNPGAPAGGTGTRYLTGSFDGEKFTPDPSSGTLWADYGKDFYATQRFSSMPPDNTRTVWIGWIGNWQYANKEPTEIWRGAQSLPRELSLRKAGDRLLLAQTPVRETVRLREKLLLDVSGVSFREANRRIQRARIEGDTLEIELSFATTSQTAELTLRKGATEKTVVGVSGGRAFVDRTQSGESEFSEDFPGRFSTPKSEQPRSLHVFLDRSSVEVFFNNGEYVLTNRIYPSPESRGVQLSSQSPSMRVARLRIWKLKSVWK